MKLEMKKVTVLSKAQMKKVKGGDNNESCISLCRIGFPGDLSRLILCERQCYMEQTT